MEALGEGKLNMATPIEILAILGSLRKKLIQSRGFARRARAAPRGRADGGFHARGNSELQPGRRRESSAASGGTQGSIRAADAILIVTPEYNYSIPGVLKNAIDWSSRRGADNLLVWEGKPVAMMGASMGAQGTSRAQYHLRQVFVFLDALPLNKPEVMICGAAQKFDADGRLTDERTREAIRKLLEALVSVDAATCRRGELR